MVLYIILQILSIHLDFWKSSASFSHKNRTPAGACAVLGFCCQLVSQSDGSQQITLRQNHSYCAQV